MSDPRTEEQRRSAIAWAVKLTAESGLAPDHYEQGLLEAYAKGSLSLEQVLHLLDTRVYHVLYRSQATHLLGEAQLMELLAQSQARNSVHHITGLLCYCKDGHFVQVLEGSQAAVEAVYARIQQDGRHHQLEVFSRGANPIRQFADWSMAFIQLAPPDFHWLIGYLEARNALPGSPKVLVEEPLLRTLLQAFGTV